MKWLDDSVIKAIFAFMVLSATIGGFFMKIIDATTFMTLAGVIVQHYFNDKNNKTLQKQIDDKDAQIQSMSLPR